jgi:hypothetical protein
VLFLCLVCYVFVCFLFCVVSLRESTPYPPSGDIEREHTLSTIWGHWERAHPIHHLGTLRESTPYAPSGDIEREHTLSTIWGYWERAAHPIHHLGTLGESTSYLPSGDIERAHPIHHLGTLKENTPYPPSGDIEREHTLSTIWGHWERAHPIHFKMMKDLIKYNCLRVDIQLIVMCHFFILFYWTT